MIVCVAHLKYFGSLALKFLINGCSDIWLYPSVPSVIHVSETDNRNKANLEVALAIGIGLGLGLTFASNIPRVSATLCTRPRTLIKCCVAVKVVFWKRFRYYLSFNTQGFIASIGTDFISNEILFYCLLKYLYELFVSR